MAPSAMANRARARSTWAAGALSERLRRVSSWRSSAVSGRRGSFRWRDMGHLGARGSPHHYTSSHGRRPTSGIGRRGNAKRPLSIDRSRCNHNGPAMLDSFSGQRPRYIIPALGRLYDSLRSGLAGPARHGWDEPDPARDAELFMAFNGPGMD